MTTFPERTADARGQGTAAQEARPGTDSAALLRLALRLDAVASAALGVLAVAAAPVLDDLLGIPAALLWPVGVFLLGYAGLVWAVAARVPISRRLAWAVVGVNLLWIVESVAAVALGWLSPTGWGTAVVLAQAAAVAVLADLQYTGLRRLRTGSAPARA
jgi:hypothetical protein